MSEEKTTKNVTVDKQLYHRAEEAVPEISRRLGFKVTTPQAFGFLCQQGLFVLDEAEEEEKGGEEPEDNTPAF